MKNKRLLTAAAGLTLLFAAGCGIKPAAASIPDQAGDSQGHGHDASVHSAEALQMKPVQVSLINAKGEQMGVAILAATSEGTQISLQASGLKPGEHGIHFHQFGKCEKPDFKSAGEHFNPYGKHHGLENLQGPHAGDLPNIVADGDGKVKTTFVTKLATLGKGMPNSLQNKGGSAIVIHEGADDQKTDPAGNSGGRVACGVIPAI